MTSLAKPQDQLPPTVQLGSNLDDFFNKTPEFPTEVRKNNTNGPPSPVKESSMLEYKALPEAPSPSDMEVDAQPPTATTAATPATTSTSTATAVPATTATATSPTGATSVSIPQKNPPSSGPSSPQPNSKAQPTLATTAVTATAASTEQLAGITNTNGDVIQDAYPLGEAKDQIFHVDLATIPPPRPQSTNLSETGRRGYEMVQQQQQQQQSPQPSASDAAAVAAFSAEIQADLIQKSRRLEELELKNEALEQAMEDYAQYRHHTQQALQQHQYNTQRLMHEQRELQEKLAKRERDYEVMSKNYLEHVRLIRATDDDHSTIMERLNQLKASIEHMIRKAQGGRSVNLNRDACLEYLKSKELLKDFPVEEAQLEAYHLNLFMESVVMKLLIDHFFDQPLSCVFAFNEGFEKIYGWMLERNEKQAVRWRQQLCLMINKDPETKILQEAKVGFASQAIVDLLNKVYTNSGELTSKVNEVCARSVELSLAMTGLESVIRPVWVDLGTDFDEELMATSLKNNIEGKVALVIFPSFRDTESAFNVRPKVWCK